MKCMKFCKILRNLVVREKTRLRRWDTFKIWKLFKITQIVFKCVEITRGKVGISRGRRAYAPRHAEAGERVEILTFK